MKTLLLPLGCLLAALCADAASVENTVFQNKLPQGITIVRAEIELPAHDLWSVDPLAADSCLSQLMIKMPQSSGKGVQGTRYRRMEEARALREGSRHLDSLYWSCRQYAETHEGMGPETWGSMTTELGQYVRGVTNRYFLVANTPMLQADKTPLPTAVPLAVELTPALDDGKHWVQLSNGQRMRRPIDPEFVAAHGLEIRPDRKSGIASVGKGEKVPWEIFAIYHEARGSSVTLKLKSERGESLDVVWDLANAKPAKEDVALEWQNLRQGFWEYAAAQSSDFTIYKAWLMLMGKDTPNGRRRRGEETDVFGILGGRAALRETLQMQPLTTEEEKPGEEAEKVEISQMAGVNVKAHPFEEMLKGEAGATLSLAGWVPVDRFYVNFLKPEALLPLLDSGKDFIFRLMLPFSGNPAGYALQDRYVQRLGLQEEWMREFLKSGAVVDLAMFMPDLFWNDGTDITVLARVKSVSTFATLLKALGVGEIAKDIVEVPTTSGQSAWWALRGDVFVAGSHRGEVETALALGAAKGSGSLGESAEFRYMLTQLPAREQTRALAYISDPFIRNLTGPRVKIGQLRRLQARRDLELLTDAALLYRADGHRDTPSLETLIAKGYFPEDRAGRDYSLRADLVAVSATYGTLANPRSLLDVPLEYATKKEAKAYDAYLQNYTRFWRQFFDPIAIRLDDEADGGLSMTTFILPLLDSSIYNGLREMVASKEDRIPLIVPEATPLPVAQFSLNLREEAWQEIVEGYAEVFGQLQINPAVLDEMGPALHFAVLDSDPVLALGGSDLLGLFGSRVLSSGGSDSMFWISMLASALTRPCVLMAELRDPEVVIQALNQASASGTTQDRFESLVVEFYRVAGRERWVCTLDLFQIARLRFGVEVRDGMLIVDNLPWAPWPTSLEKRAEGLNGISLSVHPEVAMEQLAAMFTSAMETEKKMAMQGLLRLQPLFGAGEADVASALKHHMEWFGFAPVHPGTGEWIWQEGVLSSSVFGRPGQEVQPMHEEGSRAFGIFQDIQNLRMNLQFEDSGLRVRAEWR